MKDQIERGAWSLIKPEGETKPTSGRFGHTLLIHKNQLIMFGGSGIKNNVCSLLNDGIWIFNLTSK